MRHPKELSDDEIKEMVFSIKKGLEEKFGKQRVSLHMQLNADIVSETFRLTYLAMRTQLEKEIK